MPENQLICSECGGECCKNLPGIFHPDDIQPLTVHNIATNLALGVWAIDWWVDSTNIYYLRPATVDGHSIRDPSWGGICVFLTDSGCKLNYRERPRSCRKLVPTVGDGECGCKIGKYIAARWWIDYQQLLDDASEQGTFLLKETNHANCELEG